LITKNKQKLLLNFLSMKISISVLSLLFSTFSFFISFLLIDRFASLYMFYVYAAVVAFIAGGILALTSLYKKEYGMHLVFIILSFIVLFLSFIFFIFFISI